MLPLNMTSKGITKINVLVLEMTLQEGECRHMDTFVEIHHHSGNRQEPVAWCVSIFVAVQMLLALVSGIAPRKSTPKRVVRDRA